MIKFGSTYVFSLLQTIPKSNTIFKMFQMLKTAIALIVLSQANKRFSTYFGLLRYIANFNELQFSRLLIGVHAKLLVDPTKMKL